MLRSSIFKNSLKGLTALGKKMIKTVQKLLRQYDKVVTKSTFDSLELSEGFIGLQSKELCLYGSKVFDYIEQGREPGAPMPPQGVLLEWMQGRGIPLSAEFPIRRAISINGIAPTPILATAFIELQQEASDKFADEILLNISKDIGDLYRKGFNFPIQLKL